jgi:AcrR family transcriptional regulator
MLHATVKLLQIHAPADVTVHMIAAEAGVHHDYIARYFTSREELLIQVTEIPMTGDVIEVEAAQGEKLLDAVSTSSTGFQLAKRRHHLIAYLLACGVDPGRFTETQEVLIKNSMDLFTKAELTERSKRNFSLISILLMQSIALMGDVNGMTEQDKEDISTFIIGMGAITPLAQTSFGWDKPAKSAPKKRK